jgi:gamma-glutamyltranspeptidase
MTVTASAPLPPAGARSPAMATRFMASAPHALAAAAGADVLRSGGSAADAAVAMAATLSVVYPHMTGIGGDLFALYYDARSGETAAYNGSGAAAALATVDRYAANGMRAIPERGGPSALTVPGAVEGWFALHERFGRRDIPRLLEPAIRYARDGVPVARSLARSLAEERHLLLEDDGASAVYGAGLGIGDLLVQPALAKTLERIASDGREYFYRGEGAAAIDAYCRRIDSPLRADDLAAHRGEWTAPLASEFRGFASLTTPPNSQGLALLLAQALYEERVGEDRPADGSAPFVHVTVEASRIAYAERDRYVGDPRAMPGPPARLLSRDWARSRATAIHANRVGKSGPIAVDAGSTTYFACVDSDGNAASVIQSIYQHFGAAVVVPELGIALHDRGCWFTLDEGNPRSLVPGRRPFHTLIANMLQRGGRPEVVYGSMGGDGQPQTGLALSIRIAERGMDPQAAIDAPRWRYGRSAIDGEPEVLIESRVGAACIAGLRARGHRISVAGEWEQAMGHAGAIVIDRDRGVMFGGADPRGDGAAIGE